METPILKRLLVKKSAAPEPAQPPPATDPATDPVLPEDSRFLRTPALAQVLGVRTMAVRNWVRRGLIPTVEGDALGEKQWPHFEVEKVRAALNTNEEARIELGIELNRVRRARERAQKKRGKKNEAAPAKATTD